jgi:hypothetical protein
MIHPDFRHDDVLGPSIIARDGKRNAARRAVGFPVFEQVPCVDVVERFDHRAAELL